MKQKIAIAIDFSNENFNTQQYTSQFPNDTVFKFGLEFFTKFGSQPLFEIKNEIFLDLKFFDIPNTVHHAVYNICQIPTVSYLTIHASGGHKMIASAIEARNKTNSIAKIICVTKLTSEESTADDVLKLTEVAIKNNADGIVCSALEVSAVRKNFGNDIFIITPGIRPLWYPKQDDQVRICTPNEAFQMGSNMIVIGRPITKSSNPTKALANIFNSHFQ